MPPQNDSRMANIIRAVIVEQGLPDGFYVRITTLVNELGLDWKNSIRGSLLTADETRLWYFQSPANPDQRTIGIDEACLGGDEYFCLLDAICAYYEAPNRALDSLKTAFRNALEGAIGHELSRDDEVRVLEDLRGGRMLAAVLPRAVFGPRAETGANGLESDLVLLKELATNYQAIFDSGAGYINLCQNAYRELFDIAVRMFGLARFDLNNQQQWDSLSHCAAVSPYFKLSSSEAATWAEMVHGLLAAVGCMLHVKIKGFRHPRRLQDQIEPRRFEALVNPLIGIMDRQVRALRTCARTMSMKGRLMVQMNPRCVAIEMVKRSQFGNTHGHIDCAHGRNCGVHNNWGVHMN